MARSVDRDGLRNRMESFFLTRFGLFWKLVQAVPWIRQWFNQKLLRSAILKTKVRPHALSLKSDYPTWESLTDRTYSGRHLPPASDDFIAGLPDPVSVTKLFQRSPESARASRKSTVLRIVIEDYINHITPYHFKFFLDAAPFKRESWYRTNWMTVEFNLLYRWHSMVPDTVLIDKKHVPVASTLFNNQLLIDRGLGPMFESAAKQCASELGLSNTTTNLMDAEYGALILGRKARLRSYNEYRELFGFPRVTDWAQITGDEQRQKALRELYGHVDKLEFFTGLFAEDVRPNSALSPLIGRMVGVDAFSQALTNPLLSVNVFNPATFSDVGWKIIHETNSISQLLHRNLGSDTNKYAIKFTQDGDEIPASPGSVSSELWQGPGNWAQRVAQLQTHSMKARSLETPKTTTEDRDMFVK